MKKERVLSGVQPTGESMHLGNYLGAVKGMLALQESQTASSPLWITMPSLRSTIRR